MPNQTPKPHCNKTIAPTDNETPAHPTDKLSPYDLKAIEIANNNPTLTPLGIGKELVAQGESKHPHTIYKRLGKSDILSGEIARIRTYHREFVSREIVPKALMILKSVLCNQRIANYKKKDWVKMALDIDFKMDQQTTPTIATINAQNLQIVMNNVLQG